MYWDIIQLTVQYVRHHVRVFSVCGIIKKLNVMCNAILLVRIAQTISWQGTLMPFHFDRFMTFIYLVVHAFFVQFTSRFINA